MPTAIILLAAGASSRLGSPKQLVDVDGEPLVRHLARRLVALDAGPVAVVVGAAGDEIQAAIGDLVVQDVGVVVVRNDDWSRGIGTSIRAGVVWADSRHFDAAMICLCDQPDVDAPHLRLLLDRSAATRADVIATAYAGTLGVPAVFARSTFGRLLALPDDRGAKAIFGDTSLRVERVACASAAVDLDTPDDVRRWRAGRK